jgi:hypothetical protein
MKDLLDKFKKSLETKEENVLNEEIGGMVDLKPITKIETLNSPKANWENKFDAYLAEASKESLNPIVDNKVEKEINTKEGEEKIKAEEKETAEEVINTQDRNYDYSPQVDNINNVNGQEMLNGVYLEVKYNPSLTIEEAQAMVIKNLAKDPLHYVKEGQFGVKGLGYSEAKTQKAEGKFAASGYSEKLKDGGTEMVPVKESKDDTLRKLIKESLGGVVSIGNPNSVAMQQGEVVKQMMKEEGLTESPNSLNTFMSSLSEENKEEELPMDENEDKFEEAREAAIEASQEKAGMEEEARPDYPDVDGDGDTKEPMVKALKDKKKMKKESIDSKLAEIGKQGDIVKLEAQIGFLDEEIATKSSRVNSISEDENLSELVDKKKMKEMQREIKLLEKKSLGMKKVYEKLAEKKYYEEKIVDEIESSEAE